MDRRAFLQSGVAVTGAVVAGCASDGPTGTLATYVSDQPGDIGDFESCVVSVDEIRVLPAASATGTADHDGDELTFSVSGVTLDLVDLTGEAATLAETVELRTEEYAYLKLGISTVEASLADGGMAMVTTPGNARLKFPQSFEIRTGRTTRFTADFTPVARGGTGRYVLKPVAEETTVSYGE
ncbi:DUF4382 domain-containing protein [Halomicroarcula sp. S1AR25-4]|uniref:DUF4382 domain-containing protein n=1 Tax=Haloarcula sp. S1AR25-4 TaxID=2950538 RepID=UPI00287714AB|nr:DUF4382 domain-containing protein [Halomicroarcula sp. S1AR25-4]MDS0277919.1 DUF4382 domain-containing protein [Halomicroarcula sp. S1AR25-4]